MNDTIIRPVDYQTAVTAETLPLSQQLVLTGIQLDQKVKFVLENLVRSRIAKVEIQEHTNQNTWPAQVDGYTVLVTRIKGREAEL